MTDAYRKKDLSSKQFFDMGLELPFREAQPRRDHDLAKQSAREGVSHVGDPDKSQTRRRYSEGDHRMTPGRYNEEDIER